MLDMEEPRVVDRIQRKKKKNLDTSSPKGVEI
jgi:hypothetical protein